MKNHVQKGDVITVTTPAGGALSGDPVQIGALFGVAAYSAPEGAPLEIAMEGVFDLPKAAGVALGAGDRAYFDPATKALGAQAEGLAWVGVVTQGAQAGGSTVRVRLNEVAIV
jgi:predicted RecA/RadA family phage recombinase